MLNIANLGTISESQSSAGNYFFVLAGMMTAGSVVVVLVDVGMENIGILSHRRIEVTCIVSEILSQGR